MKYVLFVFLLFFGSLSHAGCRDVAEFQDEILEIYIGDGGCGPMEITVWEYKNGKTKPSSIKTFDFFKECSLMDGRNAQISCRINPENPISGATYKKFKSGSYYCQNVGERTAAFKYKCIKGCKGKPAFLKVPEDCS